MMASVSLDSTVANRFISSLSKSLQALCHGCMDFESGIEIVGYINVNVDCGNKIDYVLNEKVNRSVDNAMTFVSNSFLAQKNPIKQYRDQSCSPVQESEIPQIMTGNRRTYDLCSNVQNRGDFTNSSSESENSSIASRKRRIMEKTKVKNIDSQQFSLLSSSFSQSLETQNSSASNVIETNSNLENIVKEEYNDVDNKNISECQSSKHTSLSEIVENESIQAFGMNSENSFKKDSAFDGGGELIREEDHISRKPSDTSPDDHETSILENQPNLEVIDVDDEQCEQIGKKY